MINAAIRKMASDVCARRAAEQDLLIAQFIAKNPEVPIDKIVLTEQRHDDGHISWSVRAR